MRTDEQFSQALAGLLAERGLSQRQLAELADVEQSHLSRLLRRADSRLRPSADLAERIAVALGLPRDYFREYREGAIIERIRTDSRALNRLYRSL